MDQKIKIELVKFKDIKMLMNLSCKLYSNIVAFAQDKRGVTAIEYAIIGVAVSAIVLTMFNSDLKTALTGAMTKITQNISNAGNAVSGGQ